MSKRPSTQRSLTAALGNENTSAAPAAASPSGPEGSGDTSRALVAAQHPPGLPASPSASPDPKRSRSSFPREPRFKLKTFNVDDYDWYNIAPCTALECIFFGDYASLLELCLHLHSINRLLEPNGRRLQSRDLLLTGLHYNRPDLQHLILCSLLKKSDGEIWAPTISAATFRYILTEAFQQHRLKNNAIAIEVLQNTAGLTAQAVKDIAAKPAPAGLAGDAPPITTWADMLKQHTTSTTSAVAAQLQRQTLDLREEAELAKRSLNVIVKNLKMEEGRAAPPLLLTFKTPADKISFLRRRKRLEKTLFTLDDDLTLAQQQRRRELWPTYLQLRQTKAGQPVYWKGAAIYVGHKPWQVTPSTTAAPATPDAPA
eukprot:jgi/Mesvir1/248/Mv13590-RA.1